MENHKGRVLGVDGGGTSTICILADGAGTMLASVEAPPSNHRKSDFASVAEAITDGLNSLARQVGLDSYQDLRLMSACVGLAGVDTDDDVVKLQQVLSGVVTADYLQVVNDGEIALEGALDGEPGLLVISGTGSIVWACAQDGKRVRVGGWDYVMSDEGSGYHIGTMILHAVTAAYDRRTGPTVLTDQVYKALGVRNFSDMLTAVYEEKLTPQVIASLAPLADQAAEMNDAIAINMLKNTASELADLASAGIRLAGLNDATSFPVVPMGGALLADGFFARQFCSVMSGRFPNARLVKARRSPAEGAVRLALKESRGQRLEVRG
jgi:N-acetylglucosamine kinase-like BadF-type ATPase